MKENEVVLTYRWQFQDGRSKGMDTEQDNTWIFAVCVIAVLILGGVIAFAISRARVKQTNIGTVTDVEGRFTVKDTEKLVAQSGETPSRDVLSAVMSEIEK